MFLKLRLFVAKVLFMHSPTFNHVKMTISNVNGDENGEGPSRLPMSLPEYARYGRQMILPTIGLPGQLKLRSARVLVVGAGGLGCPSIQYLAAAGIGHITVVDHDVVETSNLSRQILHIQARIGMSKVLSIKEAVKQINPHVTINAVQEVLSTHNAVRLLQTHDLVLDCTDNALTRYLISDAAVLTARQVVSGAAQGVEGQLIVLHRDLTPGSACSGLSSMQDDGGTAAAAAADIARPRGPCYRCLFPRAPRPESVTNCEDDGVLGTITGLVGTMQAFEAINLLLGAASCEGEPDTVSPTAMTLVSPFSYPPFRSIKLRPRQIASCRACGNANNVERIAADLSNEDYVAFCGLDKAHLSAAAAVEHVSAAALAQAGRSAFILDVRTKVEYGIASIPGSKNIPIGTIDVDPIAIYAELSRAIKQSTDSVYVLCRRGNDSILACQALSAAAHQHSAEAGIAAALRFINVTGGLRAWSEEVDQDLPVY
jgi:molybdopterin/thiamine biosynthesis adenylyltransferase/rhodanese-related sulfurtransferase